MSTPPTRIVPPSYRLRYRISSPTAIYMSNDRPALEEILYNLDKERFFLESGLLVLRRNNFWLRYEMGESPPVTPALLQTRAEPRQYLYERMHVIELEVIKNECIKMFATNQGMLYDSHRFRDENQEMTRRIVERRGGIGRGLEGS